MSILAVPAKIRACIKALSESLSTHRELKVSQKRINEVISAICEKLDLKRVALLATITHRYMAVGRFCLIHNHQMDLWINDENNSDSISQILSWVLKGKKMCVEIFENSNLSPENVSKFKDMLVREFQTVQTAILNYSDLGKSDRIMPCLKESECRPDAELTSKGIKYQGPRSMVENCHGSVCIANGHDVEPLNINRSITFIDHHPGFYIPTIHTYDLLELIHDILPENYLDRINRYSNKHFNKEVSEELRARYDREICLILRYHDWLKLVSVDH